MYLAAIKRVEMRVDRRPAVWQAKAVSISIAEPKRRGGSYAQFAEMIVEKEPNVRNKLSLGKFSAANMLQCLDSLGLPSLKLG